MEGSQQFVEIVKQGTQQIMPVPIPESGISNVPKPNGDLVHAVYKPYDHNHKNDNMQYCNFIPPAPRDPLVNVPYLGKGCPYDADAKNKPEGCFLVKNKNQNTTGFVCKDAGGTKNANFVRGNQFGVDFDMDVDGLSKSKKVEYTIENPVQLPIQIGNTTRSFEDQMRNPIVKYDKSTFYPTYLQSYNSLGEYPHASNYDNENIAKGLPTYKYPYKVINPRENEADVISLRNKDNFLNKKEGNNGVVQEENKILEFSDKFDYHFSINSYNDYTNPSNLMTRKNMVENYGNTRDTVTFEGMGENKYMTISQKYTTVTIIFTILVLIIILMLIFCKKIELDCLFKKFNKFIKK